MEITEEAPPRLPLVSLNHVSFLCRSVAESVKFYVEVLGFTLVKRPSSFKFEGAWLFNYGVGIHLLESNSKEDAPKKKKGAINPKDNHISFQCSDMGLVMRKLEEMGVEYVMAEVEEGGIKVDQIFFHDPDGNMVEICNCNNLPVLPLSSCPINKAGFSEDIQGKEQSKSRCSDEAKEQDQMIDILMTDMMHISF